MAAVADQPRLRGIVPALALGVGAGAAVVSGSKAIQAGFVASVISIPTVWMVISVERFGLTLLMASLLLLPPLPLPFGDSGPHPAAAVAALCVMAALIRLPEWRVPLTPVTLSWGALLAAMALSLGSALVNSGTGVAVASAARLGLFSIGPFVFLSAAFGPDRLSPAKAMRATRWLFWVAAAAAAVGVLDFFYQLPAPAGFEPQFVWLDSGVFRRAQGLFYESSTLGNFCAFFLVMIAVALTEPRERRPMQSAWLCAGAAVLGTALLLSYSRASVSTVVLGVLVLAFLRRKQRALLKMGIGLAVCALAVLVITTVWFPEFADSYWARLGFSLDNLWASPDRVLSGRLTSWRAILGFMYEHPWQTMAGIGYKTLPYSTHIGKAVIADNTYLSMLVETGLAGLMSLLMLHVSILTLCWRARRIPGKSFFATWMLCFWIGESVQMLSGDLLTYWRVLPVFCWVLAQVAQVARGASAYADSGD